MRLVVSVHAHTTLSLALPSGCCTRAEILRTSSVWGRTTSYPFRLKHKYFTELVLLKDSGNVGKSN